MNEENSLAIIGANVVITGTIETQGGCDRLIVNGVVNGSIITAGALEIGEEGVINASPEMIIDCSELEVAGRITGIGVKVRTDSFILHETGRVEVEALCLPPGGMRKAQGFFSGKLDMSKDYIRRPVRTGSPVNQSDEACQVKASSVSSPPVKAQQHLRSTTPVVQESIPEPRERENDFSTSFGVPRINVTQPRSDYKSLPLPGDPRNR